MSVEDMVAAREGFEQWRRGDFSSIDESSSQDAEATSLFNRTRLRTPSRRATDGA